MSKLLCIFNKLFINYYSKFSRTYDERAADSTGESLVKSTLQKYRACEKFKFICVRCKTENIVAAAFKPAQGNTYVAALQKCTNSDCSIGPYQYVIAIRNQLILSMRSFITRFYQNWLVCDDPACNQNTRCYTHVTSGRRPVCMRCKNGTLVRQYTERDLYDQLSYFQYMFDLSKHHHKSKFNLIVEILLDFNHNIFYLFLVVVFFYRCDHIA